MAAHKASVSMKDVAALAGVSLGTVSNVVNSPDLVSDADPGAGQRPRSPSWAGCPTSRPGSCGPGGAGRSAWW